MSRNVRRGNAQPAKSDVKTEAIIAKVKSEVTAEEFTPDENVVTQQTKPTGGNNGGGKGFSGASFPGKPSDKPNSFADTLSKGLKGMLPQVVPVPLEMVEVRISYGAVFHDYTEELYNQYSYEYAQGGRDLMFSVSDLHKYVKILLSQRILRVRGKRCKVRSDYGHAVPAMLAVLLEMIGTCTDSNLGVQLVPVAGDHLQVEDINDEDFLFVNQMSSKLNVLKKFGFVFALGVPSPLTGDFEFMSFEVINDIVMHSSDQKPRAYAVAVAMVKMVGLASFLGRASYRSNYGDIRTMSMYSRQLAMSRISSDVLRN